MQHTSPMFPVRARRWLFPLLICGLVLGLWIPLSPAFRPVPGDDPSVFLYVGRTLLDGGQPYRDAWDHKQPLAYALFAGAIALGRGGAYLGLTPLWGLWLVELGGLLLTALLGYAVLRRAGPRWAAALGVSAGLLTLAVVIWTYSLEEFGLALQMLTVAVFAWMVEGTPAAVSTPAAAGTPGKWIPWRRWAYGGAAIGILSGLCFFLKQTLIGAGAAVGVYLLLRLLFRRDGRALAALAGMAAGAGLVSAGVLGYLAAHGLLADYRAAALDFNLLYSNLGPLERARALVESLRYMAGVAGLLLALALWLPCAWAALRQQGRELARLLRWRWSAPALAGLGTAAVLVSLAGELVGRGERGLGLVQWLLIGPGLVLTGAGGLLWAAPRRARFAEWLERGRSLPPGDPRGPLLSLAALYLPAALALVTLSGRGYVYYYIICVPPLILLAGLSAAAWVQQQRLGAAPRMGAQRPSALRSVLMGLVLLAVAAQPLWMVIGQYRRGPSPLPRIGQYVVRHTRAEDTILVWGTSYVYYLAQRGAPSRYFYQAPIFSDGYNQRYHVVSELLDDLRARPPALFLTSGEPLPGNCAALRASPPDSPEQVLGFVCAQYRLLEQIDEFQVYGLK